MLLSRLLFIGVISLLIYLVRWLRRRFTYWQRRGIACEKPNWLFGNLRGVRTTRAFVDIWQSYYDRFKGTGPFAGFYWFFRPAAFVLDIALIKNILIKDFHYFTDRGFYSNEPDDPLSGQLLLLDGHRWRNMRNKLSPTFTSGKMKSMFPTIVAVGQELTEVLGSLIGGGSAVVEVKDLMARFTTDVIGTCAFGIECNSLKDPEVEFRVMGKRALVEHRHSMPVIMLMASFRNFARRLHLKQTPQDVEQFFLRIVRETVAYREQNHIRRNDFLDTLIDLKNKKLIRSEHGDDLTNLTLEEITAQAFVFFLAGFETSSTTMGFALYELARHPHIQQRARDEVAAVLEKHNREFTYESMKEMQYLDQIISETLRLYTVLPVLNREALEDYVVPGHTGYVIEKGTQIIIPAAAIHRDEAYYPQPLVFNPDNFAPELVAGRDAILWLAFGEGPRNCIGKRFGQMQTRFGLALLLKHFKFGVCPETEIPLTFSKQSFLLSTDTGIYLEVTQIE